MKILLLSPQSKRESAIGEKEIPVRDSPEHASPTNKRRLIAHESTLRQNNSTQPLISCAVNVCVEQKLR
jgi:hypothetical protein